MKILQFVFTNKSCFLSRPTCCQRHNNPKHLLKYSAPFILYLRPSWTLSTAQCYQEFVTHGNPLLYHSILSAVFARGTNFLFLLRILIDLCISISNRMEENSTSVQIEKWSIVWRASLSYRGLGKLGEHGKRIELLEATAKSNSRFLGPVE